MKLSLSEEAEWEEYFNQESEKAKAIKTRIAATDREIDQLVVALYERTEEEIGIVEGKFFGVTERVTPSHPLSGIIMGEFKNRIK